MTVAALLLCVLSYAQDPKLEKDVVYGTGGGEKLMLDLARPAKGDGPFPLVVLVHGGAWQTGSRAEHHANVLMLAKEGYVAVTVGYRLAPKHRWPAQIEDVKCAVRFLRSKAKEYRIDADRVGLGGTSAGGHLALMAGLGDVKDGLEGKGGHEKFSSGGVKCVVNYFGPTDLRVWKPTPIGELAFRATTGGQKGGEEILKDFAGTADRKAAVMARLSPVTYVKKTSPPVLTFHGTLDPLVPLSQAQLLHQALEKAGVEQKLVVMQNKLHGWEGEDLAATNRQALAFFDKHLKAKK